MTGEEDHTAGLAGTAPASTELPVSAAVELLHVLVHRAAQRIGVRVLFIKSLAARHHGLRSHTGSSDVDVWVDPAGLGDLLAELGRGGWLTRPHDHESDVFALHSVTLVRAGWPADLDLHHRFPGLESPSAELFAAVWANRVPMPVAGHEVSVPGWADTAVVEAANWLRTPWAPTTATRLRALQAAVESRPAGTAEVAARAMDLTATAALRPLLERLGVQEPATGWPAPSREWVVATASRSWSVRRLLKIVSAPLAEKPRWIADALRPSDDAVRAQDVYADGARLSGYRRRRLVKFLRQSPAAARGAWTVLVSGRRVSGFASAMPPGVLRSQPRAAQPADLRPLDPVETRQGSTHPSPASAGGSTAAGAAPSSGSALAVPDNTAWTPRPEDATCFVLPAGQDQAVALQGLAATVFEYLSEQDGPVERADLMAALVPQAPLPPALAEDRLREAAGGLCAAGVLVPAGPPGPVERR